MVIIGLAGGIGTGKDEVAKIFRNLGTKIINADEVGHTLLRKNSPAYKKIAKIFGLEILDSRCEIDRKKLGGVVFNNKNKLRLLNKIIHPLMEKEFRKKIKEYRNKDVRTTILNAAVLFEAGWDELVDKTILVTAPKELRIRRLAKKGISRKKALNMISSQWSDERKKKKADFIIKNNGSLAGLKKKIKELIYEIRGE